MLDGLNETVKQTFKEEEVHVAGIFFCSPQTDTQISAVDSGACGVHHGGRRRSRPRFRV